MSEPLILVEGNLRLPTLRALTEPSLNFGFEWSPARSRPVQTPSEFALFAARLVTAYVPALSLSDIHSPYRATSLWGIFAKEEIPRAMLNLTQGSNAQDDADEPRAEPVHLTVNAPAHARGHGFGKLVVGAIAAACGVLIIWMLFAHPPVSRSVTPPAPAEETATRTQPAQPAAPTGQAARVEQESETPMPPVVATPPSADSHAIETVDSAATKTEVASAATEPDEAPVHVVAPAEDRKHIARVKAVLTPHTKRAVHVAQATSERVVKPAAPRRVRAASAEKIASGPSKASLSMDPATLSSMLQHSPTLDSNAASSGRGAANGAR